MKKLFLLLCLLSSPAHAALSEADRAIHSRDYVQLLNPGFEQGKSKWTASAGTFTTQSTSVMAGSAASWVLSGATGSLSQDVTPSVATPGVPYESSMWVNTGASTFQVCARQAGVETQCAPVSADSNWHKYSLNYSAPSSGSVGVDLSTTQSTTGTAYVDNAYTGIATNLAQVSQAQLVGTAVVTGCASNWTETGTSFATLGTQTGCSYAVTGAAQAPSTNVAGFKFASLPPGEYKIEYEGLWGASAVATTNQLQFTDGTITAREQTQVSGGTNTQGQVPSVSQTFSYTTTQSNVTWQLFGKASSGSTQVFGTTSDPGVFRLYRYPTSSQTVLGPDATAASWTGFFTGCTWSSTGITAFADTTTQVCTLTTRLNTNLGTVTQESGNHAGITFTPAKVGKVKTCVHGVAFNSAVSGAQGIRLTDGTNVADTTQINLLTTTQPFSLCLDSKVTSIAPMTVKIQTSNTAANTESIAANGNLEWEVYQLDAGQPAPLLTGSVISKSSGIQRIVHGTVSSTGTITDGGTGDWSVANVATGRQSITFSPAWPNTFYTCTCTTLSASTGGNECGEDGGGTTKTASVVGLATNSGGAFSAQAFGFTCTGNN